MVNFKSVVLESVHQKLGAKMIPFAGFNMPVRYTSDIQEHNKVRNSVGVFDVSHMGEFILKGSEALNLLQLVTSNDVATLVDGKIQYAYIPNEIGGIVDDILVYRYKFDEYYVVVNASNIEKDWNWINKYNSFDVQIKNISNDISLFAVQGPMATLTLQKLTAINLSAIKYYNFCIGTLAGVENVIISNTGYTGAGGFEIFVDNLHANQMWEAIFEAGKEYYIEPIGLGARDTLRLEKGYCLYGNDISDTTSPIEAGLGWVTKFNKKFVNCQNLEVQKREGVSRKLVGFKMLSRAIPRSLYQISDTEGNVIGEVTSGTQSPSLGYGIGMGYVDIAFANPNDEIFINIRDTKNKAQVVRLPFL